MEFSLDYRDKLDQPHKPKATQLVTFDLTSLPHVKVWILFPEKLLKTVPLKHNIM